MVLIVSKILKKNKKIRKCIQMFSNKEKLDILESLNSLLTSKTYEANMNRNIKNLKFWYMHALK